MIYGRWDPDPRIPFARAYFTHEHELGGRVAARIATGDHPRWTPTDRAETVNRLLDEAHAAASQRTE